MSAYVCPGCGAKLPDAAEFCPYCGSGSKNHRRKLARNALLASLILVALALLAYLLGQSWPGIAEWWHTTCREIGGGK